MDSYTARSYGLSQSDVAAKNDLDSILVNPAGLVDLKCIAASVFYLPWYGGMRYYSLSGGYPLFKGNKFNGTLGLNLSVFDLEPFRNYDEFGNELAKLNTGDILLSLSYAYPVWKYINTGLNLKYFNTKLGVETFTSSAVDVGVLSSFDLPVISAGKVNDSFGIGFSIQNIGFSQKYFDNKFAFPLKIRTGITYLLIKKAGTGTTLMLELNQTKNKRTKLSSGIEVNILNMYKIRMGLRLLEHDTAYSFTAGAGMNNNKYNNFSYDYSLIPLKELGVKHAFSIKIKFGDPDKKAKIEQYKEEMKEAHENKQYEKAIQKAEDILALHPSDEEALEFQKEISEKYIEIANKKKKEYRFQEAIQYLEKYKELNPEDETVVKSISELQQIMNDKESPKIVLNRFEKTDTVTVKDLHFTISGTVSDNMELKAIKINDESILLTSKKNTKLNQIIRLSQGENAIEIFAEDMKGNKTKKTIKIISTFTPPTSIQKTNIKKTNTTKTNK